MKRQQDARIGPPETRTRREFDAKEREGRGGDQNGHTWRAVTATMGGGFWWHGSTRPAAAITAAEDHELGSKGFEQ